MTDEKQPGYRSATGGHLDVLEVGFWASSRSAVYDAVLRVIPPEPRRIAASV